jgi:polyisoprenoid-binding protein YceI
MTRMIGSLVLIAAIGGAVFAADVKYGLNDDNTTVTFVGTKKDGKHDGGFKKFSGAVVVPDGDLTKAKIEVEIDTTSIYTDTEKLTTHLKSPDFFGVKANPKSKFVSAKIEKGDDGYTITGDLTLNGKTKSITFPAKLAEKDGELSLSSEFKINRLDFGMTYGKGMIDDDVALKVTVKAKK